MKRQIVINSLLFLMIVACSGSDNSYQTQAVHDRVRILGLEVQDDGLYRFKLCRVRPEYTPQVLAEECINPFLTVDGQEKVFYSVPRKPSTAIAHLRNWGLASFIGITAGVISYKFARSVVKIRKTRQLVGDAMRGKITGDIEKVLAKAKVSDDERKILEEVLEDEGLLQRVAGNKIKITKDNKDIRRLMEVEELTNKKLVELGDPHVQLETDQLTISKEAIEKELGKLEELVKKIDDNPSSQDSEKLIREKHRLQIRIAELNENLDGARFKSIEELNDKELEERITLWKNKYSNEYDSKLAEVKGAIGKETPKKTPKDSPNDDSPVKIEMKKEQRFYEKFLDKIDAGFRGFAKKFKGFPYINSKNVNYQRTRVVVGDKVGDESVVRNLIADKPVEGFTLISAPPTATGQLVGFSAFIALPLTALSHYLPGHAMLTASDSWSAVTSEIGAKHSTSVRVEDIATILDGIAQATGCRVSNKARTFAF